MSPPEKEKKPLQKWWRRVRDAGVETKLANSSRNIQKHPETSTARLLGTTQRQRRKHFFSELLSFASECNRNPSSASKLTKDTTTIRTLWGRSLWLLDRDLQLRHRELQPAATLHHVCRRRVAERWDMCVMNFLWIPFVPPPPLLVFFCAGIKTSSTKDNSPDWRMMQEQLSRETNTKMVSFSHQRRRNDAFSSALLFSCFQLFFVSGLI